MSEQGIKSTELPSFAFGDTRAMEGYNPDSTGYKEMPPGRHRVRVEDYEIHENIEFRGARPDMAKYFLHQIRPRLVVVDGPHAGASKIDFLACPPQEGQAWPALQANRFANFVRSCGFTLPKGQTVPQEMLDASRAGQNPFELLKGRECYVTIVTRVDRDTGQALTQENGLPRLDVKFFGYEPLSAGSGPAKVPAATRSARQQSSPAQQSQSGTVASAPPQEQQAFVL